VILPKAIRQQRRWGTGTRLVVEDPPDGVLLKTAPPFAPTWPEEVYGTLPPKGAPKTLEEMEAGNMADAKTAQQDRGSSALGLNPSC
jgi:bifunctional DNA-binding transcriptional regulator/antitoxin component of YhaV-PrlF toxin-antitoxin module